jgi:tetraacyldisaccharide 4'-kinase
LPLGLLREPIKEIKKADVVVLTKTNLTTSNNLSLLKKHFNNFINSKKQLVFSSEYLFSVLHYSEREFKKVDCSSFNFKETRMVSVCGIANPGSFKKALSGLGFCVLKGFVFSNHYNYSQRNTNKVAVFCLKNNINTIITTKKDFYKLKPLFRGFKFYILDVEHRIYECDKLVNYFNDKLAGNFK